MKFEINPDNTFGGVGWTGYPYSSKDDFAGASAAYFEVTGKRDDVISQRSDRVYYIIGGQGIFTVDGREFPVKEADVIIVPKNTLYGYQATDGVLKLFLVHTPAYDSDYDKEGTK